MSVIGNWLVGWLRTGALAMALWIGMPFGMKTDVYPGNIVLDVGADSPQERETWVGVGLPILLRVLPTRGHYSLDLVPMELALLSLTNVSDITDTHAVATFLKSLFT